MQHLKTMGLIAVATATLMALVGAGTASATTLIGEGGSVFTKSTSLHIENAGTVKMTTKFKNIECSESTIVAKTTDETGTTVDASVESLSFVACNCEVKVMKKGTLSIAWTAGSSGTLRSSGAEVTTTCSTIFGSVHCIYETSATELGTLSGGSPAVIDIESAAIPRLKTNPLCDEESNWDAFYVVDNPSTLGVTS